MSHTPGPWQITGIHGANPPAGYETFICNAEDTPIVTLNNYIPNDRSANAKLIAAAPELLQALIYARRFLTAEVDINFIDAAIDKATS